MGKGYLIDSNVVIGYLDNKIPGTGMQFLNNVVDNIPIISVITKIEVLRFNAPESAYNILTDFTESSIICELDGDVVKQTIKLCKESRIKLPDAIIAATALVNELVVITRNTDDFKNIAGIETLNPWKMDGDKDQSSLAH